MNQTASWQAELNRIQWIALAIGGGGLALAILVTLLNLVNPAQFFQSYLFAYLFWLGLALGCFGISMLHRMVGGKWGFVTRRILEAGAMVLPVMALLFLPLAFGLHELYPWAQPELVAAEEALQHRQVLYNPMAFLLRAALYLGIWSGLAYLLRRWSLAQDRTGDPAYVVRMRLLSRAGMLLYVLTTSFAAWDWAMSLEAHWYSTIYGVLFISREAVIGLAFAIALLGLLSRRPPLAEVVTPEHFYDLGKLLLGFVMIWAYIHLSQFLIIWAGNLPEEVTWYTARIRGGWGWIGRFLILTLFVLPFLLLLSRRLKFSIPVLSTLAATIVLLFLVDLFWFIVPTFHPADLQVHLFDLLIPIGIGGIWVAAFVWQLKGQPLLPRYADAAPTSTQLQKAPSHG
ncbi:MAG: hypothetical protein ACLFVO_27040 [Chloroflexaceae bacterium]